MSPIENASGQGRCLPPLLPEISPWPSEGILTRRLVRKNGVDETVRIFEAHRRSYIGTDDLRKVTRLGMETIRVPLPWATFADSLKPLNPKIYNDGVQIVPDPYYNDTHFFAVVNRTWLEEFLRKVADHRLKIVWDLHSMPGGSSDGTYNGIWPNKPRFWTERVTVGDSKKRLTDVGLMVVKGLISWIKSLGEKEFGAVAGVCLMNEPAHMAAIDASAGMPFVQSERQVLDWLESAADLFRKSPLPGKGLKLYLNLIETTFMDFWTTVPKWWNEAFTWDERHNWAIMDIHWYTAWSPQCNGRVVSGGGYFCDDPINKIQDLLESCANGFLTQFTTKIDGLKACSEFSVGTFEDAVVACNDMDVLHMFLAKQVELFERHGVEAFFWTWRMPYGSTFQACVTFSLGGGHSHACLRVYPGA